VEDTGFALAMTVDCNNRHVLLDPYEGGKGVVAEAARNLACTGARPLGVTDCLNFGNPQRPEIFFQFREACRGIADACRAFDTPVTGGNVSLYNQSPLGAIDPTPTVGMIGLLEDVYRAVPSQFRDPDDAILLLGVTRGHLGGSALWAELLDTLAGAPPPIDLAAERALQDFLVTAAARGHLRSAHDCADGGLAVALAECCMGGPWANGTLGAEVDLGGHADDVPDLGWLYGEDAGRVVISVAPEDTLTMQRLAGAHGVPCHLLGVVGAPGGDLVIRRGESRWSWSTGRLRAIYHDAIPRRMAGGSSTGGQ
jgi:phosphoribosylformylglycinamidine synthase